MSFKSNIDSLSSIELSFYRDQHFKVRMEVMSKL